MRALLDVNVLIALLDADHVHHTRAREWLRAHVAQGWASCPITQNGCVRIMAQPAYPSPLPPSAVIERLARAASHRAHEFWPDDATILDMHSVDRNRIHGSKQITDLYLLALAVKHGGRLATFDGAIALSAVPRASKEHLAAI